jgi:hypothetical protein
VGGGLSVMRQEMMAPSTVLPRKRRDGRNQASTAKDPGSSNHCGAIPAAAATPRHVDEGARSGRGGLGWRGGAGAQIDFGSGCGVGEGGWGGAAVCVFSN